MNQGLLDAPLTAPARPATPARTLRTVLVQTYHPYTQFTHVHPLGIMMIAAQARKDELEGDRHQRFVLELEGGQTVLVAHNIDVAPRVPLERSDVGAAIEFRGQYEWNAQGGVVHWTHRDPDGSHPGGWLRFGGKTYE